MLSAVSVSSQRCRFPCTIMPKDFLKETRDHYKLLFELFGPAGNLYLLGDSGEMVTALKAHKMEVVYDPPKPPEGCPPDQIDMSFLRRSLSGREDQSVADFLDVAIRGCDKSFWFICKRIKGHLHSRRSRKLSLYLAGIQGDERFLLLPPEYCRCSGVS